MFSFLSPMPEKENESSIQKFFTLETMFDSIEKKVDGEYQYIYHSFLKENDL